ncbi:Phytanoyl-CoA dioxygenase [Penicillium canescens]|nr:Phytanoyl-CoA dioxygenase [Penicillium canescens]KAJ6165028.1 Phytanoyl-CoA dioxygenase [Penicillium canescens]
MGIGGLRSCTPDTPWMPYEEVNSDGKRVLSRTENFANSHAGFDGFLRGQRAMSVLQQLAGEEMILFKEKINHKLAGSANGGLEVVDGCYRMDIPLGSDWCIEPTWVKMSIWTPAELESGDILIFGSYLAHRSGANTSPKDRRAIYATYNCAAEGSLHDQYCLDRQKLWPATHMQQEGESYEEGRARYAFGSPMLTVDSKAIPA